MSQRLLSIPKSGPAQSEFTSIQGYFKLDMCLVTTGSTASNQNGPSEAQISAKEQADNADCSTTHKEDGSKPINQQDLDQARREHLFGLPSFAQDWIVQNLLRQKDERNITIFYVGMNNIMTSWPMAAGLFLMEKGGSTPTWALFLAGLVYFIFHLKTHAPDPSYWPCTTQRTVPFSIAIFDF